MKNLVKIFLVLCLAFTFAACSKKTANTGTGSDMMTDENLAAPTNVDVTVEDTAPVVVDVQNTEVALKVVNFDFDRYNLSTTAKNILAANAAAIKAKGSAAAVVTVEGHCDERGTIAYNIALGDKRATEVKKYYVKLGIPSSSIQTVSYGMEKPICYEATEACYAKNRRGETLVSAK